MRLVSASERATHDIARTLAPQLPPGSRLLLHGDLGAGKTAFVRGLAVGLGIAPEEVSSPTFTLVHEYHTAAGLALRHVDLYRLGEGDVADLGLDDEMGSRSLVAIEWAERWPQATSAPACVVHFWHGGGDVRVIDLEPPAGIAVRVPAPPEVWLRGPLEDVAGILQPVVHALLQVHEDAARALAGLPADAVWRQPQPAGIASLGFHARHLVGSLDRLLTYARGDALNEAQFAHLRAEADPGPQPPTATTLLEEIAEAVEGAVAAVRATPLDSLLASRKVGRAGLPTTVLGLLVHAAEHASRHAGQLVTTARVVAPPTPPHPAPARSR